MPVIMMVGSGKAKSAIKSGKPTEAIGLSNEMSIYSVTIDEEGHPVLNISGEVYAG